MFRRWRSVVDLVRRDTLVRGSPAYRWGVWVSGITGGLLWIWDTEKKAPIEERRIFLPAKREVVMNQQQILEWNQALSGGKLLAAPSQYYPCQQDLPQGKTMKEKVEGKKWKSLGSSLLHSFCSEQTGNGTGERPSSLSLSRVQAGEGRTRERAQTNQGDTDAGRHKRKQYFFGEPR